MRHGRRALLLLAEVLFGFAHLGALQVANLGRDVVERRGDDRQRANVERVPVALDDLRRNRRDVQAQALADLLFVLGIEVRAIADRPGKLADAHLLGRQFEAVDVAQHLGVPIGQLQPEGDRLGMHAVGAADHGCVLELPGAALEYVAQLLQVFANDGRSLLDEQRLCGIDHVVRGESVMQPARFRPDFLGHSSGEGDDVVLHLGFDLVDAIEVEVTLFADGDGRRLRHQSGFGERFSGCQFDLEPGAELVLVAPDMPHFGAGITCDQGVLLYRPRFRATDNPLL